MDFSIGNKIGSGGFGTVFQATRITDGRDCAVKVLSPMQDGTCDPNEARSRFAREVRMQLGLKHDNIVPVLHHDLDDAEPYFVMPRAKCPLTSFIGLHKGEPLLPFFFDVLNGMAYAHAKGVIHRDLKPDNILIFERPLGETAAVSDFGLGRLMNRDTVTLTATNIKLGTVAYMAPEQVNAFKSVDHRADIYSLGKVLYELLTGELPFPAFDFQRVPEKYRYVVKKAMEMEPDRRYQDVLWFRMDLEAAQQGGLNAKAAELIQVEVDGLGATGTWTAGDLTALARLFLNNLADPIALRQLLPTLSDDVLRGLFVHHGDKIKPVVEAYDRFVSNQRLDFDYCDVVARFYDRLFSFTEDDEVKVMVLRTLPQLGYEHNRFYVAETFGRVLSSLKETSLIMEAKEILVADPRRTWWCRKYFGGLSFPQGINAALHQAQEEAAAVGLS